MKKLIAYLKTFVLVTFIFSILLGFQFSTAYSECLIQKTLYWKMDSIDNSIIREEIRDLLHEPCTQADNPDCPQLLPEGRYGSAMKFDETTGINIVVDSVYQWSATDSFSIEFWMKRDNQNFLKNEFIIGRDDPSTELHWWIGIDPWRGGTAAVYLIDKNGENASRFCRGAKSLTDNAWHHIVFIRDGKLGMNYLYVDSELESQIPFAYSVADAFVSDSATLNIGWLNLNAGYHYKGALDEVAVYNLAIPQWFIRDQYHAIDRFGAPCE